MIVQSLVIPTPMPNTMPLRLFVWDDGHGVVVVVDDKVSQNVTKINDIKLILAMVQLTEHNISLSLDGIYSELTITKHYLRILLCK